MWSHCLRGSKMNFVICGAVLSLARRTAEISRCARNDSLRCELSRCLQQHDDFTVLPISPVISTNGRDLRAGASGESPHQPIKLFSEAKSFLANSNIIRQDPGISPYRDPRSRSKGALSNLVEAQPGCCSHCTITAMIIAGTTTSRYQDDSRSMTACRENRHTTGVPV